MPVASSATFWLLMQRWHVPDDQALKLIGFEGKPRRRFKFTPKQARTLSDLLAIDSALELAGMDRAWLHSRCSRLRRRTPLERIQAGAADEVLRVLQHSACKLGHPLPYEGAEDLMPGAYSTDLRERVLVAIEAGEAADVVAEQFMVRNLYAK